MVNIKINDLKIKLRATQMSNKRLISTYAKSYYKPVSGEDSWS
jgi:hypothetical protein